MVGLNQIQVESQEDKVVMPDNLKVGLMVAEQRKRCASGGCAEEFYGLGFGQSLHLFSKSWTQFRINFKSKDFWWLLMPFEPLCKNKIFKNVPNYDDIKEDPHMKELFSSVFTGMSGRYTRMRIICTITEEPMNAREISKKLELDYKTIQHNIKVLERNNLIVRVGEGYGDLFFPSDLISSNLPTLYKVIKNVEDKLDKSEKKYIE